MAFDVSQLVGIVAGNLGNLGGALILVKMYAKKVDSHDDALKALPLMAQSLEVVNKSMQATTKSLEELYDSRNDASERLTRIETTHEINGCASGKNKGP